MAQRSERVTRMMANFIPEWQSGKNIPEIAHDYRVTPRVIYERLQEIADKNGYERKELLEKPHKTHKKRESVICIKSKETDFSPDEVKEEIKELIEQTKLVISNIERVLNY